MTTLINPMDETQRERTQPAARIQTFEGAKVGLLDISKPGGSVFFDRLERLLVEHHDVASVVRETKPTFAKPAPESTLRSLVNSECDAVIIALAD